MRWVQMERFLGQGDKAVVSFEVLDFLFKGPKISEEKCKGYVLICHIKGTIFENIQCHWVFSQKVVGDEVI